jgi:hypothetical protein
VLGAAVAWSAWRAASAIGDERVRDPVGITSRALRAGVSVPVSTGIGLALEPGRAQRALPTRPAVVGAIVGVVGIIGGLTLAAGIGDATDHPERFGTVWDFEAYTEEVTDAFGGGLPEHVADVSGVGAVARIARLTLPVGDAVVPFYALDDVEGRTEFVVLEGDPPERGEVALGPDTADAFGVSVGGHVEVGAGGRFRVSGLALLPTTAHSSFDQGGWMHGMDLARSTPETQRDALLAEVDREAPQTDDEFRELMFAAGGVIARLTDGTDTAETVARVRRVLGPGITVDVSYGPADQQNLRNTRPLPLLFAAFALLLGVGALLHISSTVLRRRRHDLAVLRVLGLTRRQTRACLAWQATTLAVVGLLIGVPLGVVIGRLIWRSVAEQTPMVYVPPTSALALLLALPAALLVANLLVAAPAQRAARLRPAEVLRTE